MLARVALPLAVSCYLGYSAVEQQKVLKRFAVISFIAALRPEGNAELLPALAAELPSTSAPAAEVLGGNWEQVWPKVDGQKGLGGLSPAGWRATGSELLLVHADEANGVVHVLQRREMNDPAVTSVAQLVAGFQAERCGVAMIVDNPATRLAWHRALANEALWEALPVPAPTVAAATESSPLVGVWRFAFRDHVNNEERSSMLASRLTPQWLLARMPAPTRLELCPDGSAILTDRLVACGCLPLQVDWYGSLLVETQEIQWASTSARIGWRWLGRTIDRPKVAEKKRTAPWLVKRAATTPTDEPTTPIAPGSRRHRPVLSPLRLTRVGTGTLVFRAD